jgi:hypothetical protein
MNRVPSAPTHARRIVSIFGCALLGCHGAEEPAPTPLAQIVEPEPESPADAEPELPRSFDSVKFWSGGGACWIRDDGRLVCWGLDGSIGGALPGAEFARQRVVPGIHDVVQLDDGCLVTKAGEVHCLFDLERIWRHAPPSTSRAIQMAVSQSDEFGALLWGTRPSRAASTSFAVDAEGRLAWYADELERISRRDKWEFVDGLDGIVELAVGVDVCVRTEAGTLHCLDDDSPPGHLARVDIAGPVRLHASGDFIFVLDDGGVVHRVDLHEDAWRVASTGVGDVVALDGDCARRAGGVVTCGLSDQPWQLAAPPAREFVASEIVCVLAEADGSVHCADRAGARARRIQNLSPARALTLVDRRPCVLHESGEVRCMGERFGTLVLPGLQGDAIAGVDKTLCASSNGQASCWLSWRPNRILRLPIDDAVGFEEFAQLLCVRRADDSRLCVDDVDYRRIHGGPIRGLGPVAEVSVIGPVGACARERSGSVRCWGDQTDAKAGQLGDGRLKATLAPVQVVGIDDAVDIDAGYSTTCAVRSNGQVACWGRALLGEGGVHSTPITVPGFEDVAQVSVGWTSLCARHHDGGVSCAGFHVGYGQQYQFPTPTRMPGIESAVHLAAGPNNEMCALIGDVDAREVVCWGERRGEFSVESARVAAPGARGFDMINFGGMCLDIPDPRGPKCLAVDSDLTHLLWPSTGRPESDDDDHDDGRIEKIDPNAVSFPFENPWEP